MSGSMQQGRWQTMMQQQSLMQAVMNQQQQNAFNTAQQQQNGLVGIMQQQQQIAMLAALQQLQQNRQLLALQQRQNAFLVNQPVQQNLVGDAAPRRRQRRSISAEDLDNDPLPPQRQVQDTESNEEIASRRLKLAKDLTGDADQAQAQGNRRWAATLRDRAGDRLQKIVEDYPGTPSAQQAKILISNWNR
jgi:hypothetical protein